MANQEELKARTTSLENPTNTILLYLLTIWNTQLCPEDIDYPGP